MHKYTPQEDQFLRDNYMTMTMAAMASVIGVKTSAMRWRIKFIGLAGKRDCIVKSAAHPNRFRAYSSWSSMIQRCTNKNRNSWTRYGGRGIYVCKRWMDSFEAFLEDMGEKPTGYSIDRIDPSKGYEKSNCRWIPKSEQGKTTERFLEINPCIDCGSERGNRRGRCHKCNEYFRRHGRPRPNVGNVTQSGKIFGNCPQCEREKQISRVHGVCFGCYRANFMRAKRSAK